MGISRLTRALTWVAVSSVGGYAFAQTNLQKFSLDRLSFQYRSSNDNARSRCLVWKPLADDYRPRLEYDEEDRPFLRVPITAVLSNPKCPLRVEPSGALEEIDDAGAASNERSFLATVRPPVTLVRVQGPGFRDELVFEAPTRPFEGSSFFEFFRRSKVYFEGRYGSFTTNNPDESLAEPVNMVPIFGGSIAVPVPWVSFLFAGFSMFQNLGNFTPNSDVGLQYSEFAFDLRATYRGRESWGSPSVGVMGEFRGRNIYQLGTQRSFVVAAAAVPYVGFELSWYPGGALLPWDHWLSRLGFEGSGHIALQKEIAGRGFSSSFYEGVIHYRLSRKWAIGAGYSVISQDADFTDLGFGVIEESAKNYFLRLTLLPQASGVEAR